MSDLKNIHAEYTSKLKENLSSDQINQIKSDLFGKNGLISSQFKTLGSLNENERKQFASELNKIKDELQKTISEKLQELEFESAQRKAARIAKRQESELRKKQLKEAKRVASVNKKTGKENSRKLREKLARQREQDKMIASSVKLMQSFFKMKRVTKPIIDASSKKLDKEKLKRQKEYDRIDRDILKAMRSIFKATRKRTPKTKTK